MAPRYLSEGEAEVLRCHLRKKRSNTSRPIFIFPCGGNEDLFMSRRLFRDYIRHNKSDALDNVFCLTAEDIANSGAVKDLNLLQQEAVLADICDWIIVFAQSVGSYCELGAFAALPHIAQITSVGISSKYEYEHSFLNDGPARELEENSSGLSRRFYLQLDSPFSNAEFANFVSSIRRNVQVYEPLTEAGPRMGFNIDETQVRVGPLVHELMDLLQLLGPCNKDELLDSYCRIRGFHKDKIKIESTSLKEDMRSTQTSKIGFGSVIDMMIATGLARMDDKGVISSTVHLHSYFMFKDAKNFDFNRIHSRVLIRKQRDGVIRNVYRKYD